MKEPRWISAAVVRAIHLELLAEHGGRPGARDETLVEAALARARSAFQNKKKSSLHDLAAAYFTGFAKGRPFVDGNLSTALATAAVFLELNGFVLEVDEPSAVAMAWSLVAGDLAKDELAGWLRDNSHKAPHQS